MRGNGSAASRQRMAKETFDNVAASIGPLERGMALFAVTRGQWSMIDAIMYVLDRMGGGSLSVWTWVVADYEIKAVTSLMLRGDIRAATMVVDISADNRNREMLAEWRSFFGPDSVRIVRNHAKIARVWNDEYRFLLRGSMNLNWNPRFEQFDLTEGGEDFDLIERIEAELPVLPAKYMNADVHAATKLGRVFSDDVISKFGTLSATTHFDVGRLDMVEG